MSSSGRKGHLENGECRLVGEKRRVAEEVTSCESRGGKIFAYHYPPDRGMTWPSENTRAHKVGELEDEPQAGLALKRQSVQEKAETHVSRSFDCTLRPTLRLFIVAFLVISHTKPKLHLLPSPCGSARFHEWWVSSSRIVLLRVIATYSCTTRDDLSHSKFFQIFNELFIIRIKKKKTLFFITTFRNWASIV